MVSHPLPGGRLGSIFTHTHAIEVKRHGQGAAGGTRGFSYNRRFHSREIFVTRPLALGAAVGGEIGAAGGQAQPRFEEMLNLTSNRKLNVKDIASGFKGESR